VTIDITISGSTYTYEVDEEVLQWEADADLYSRLDGVTELDWRRQRVRLSITQVWVHPTGYSGTARKPMQLAQEIIMGGGATLEVRAGGNTATFDAVLAPEDLTALRTERGNERLRQEVTLIGDWLDPDNSNDKSTIDAINHLRGVLGGPPDYSGDSYSSTDYQTA